MPCAKVLGGKVSLHRFPNVVVDHCGIDRTLLAGVINVLKKLIARQVSTPSDDGRKFWILNVNFMSDAALAGKAQPQTFPPGTNVFIAEGRQSERTILPNVFRVSDPDASGFQETSDDSQDLISIQLRGLHVALYALAKMRQTSSEVDQSGKLHLISLGAVARMIPVLFPPFRVSPRRLNMTTRIRADPDIFPGGRNRERAYPR